MLEFKNWLNEHANSGKVGIYPSLYTQYYHYPPCDSITWSPDAITYMDTEDLKFNFVYSKKFVPHTWKTIDSPGKHGK